VLLKLYEKSLNLNQDHLLTTGYTHTFSPRTKILSYCQTYEQITKGKPIADLFFNLLYYVKQTLPSLVLIKEQSPHFGSEKEGEE